MTIPKYHELFSAVLKSLRDGEARRVRDVNREVADGLGLNEEEREETMNGGGNRAESRVHWAHVSLKEAGALVRPGRGYIAITPFGRELLINYPEGVPRAALEATEGLQSWYTRSRESYKVKHGQGEKVIPGTMTPDTDQSPDEQIEDGISRLRSAVASELLDRLRDESPLFFEQVVLKLLHAMGYGDGEDSTQHLGGTGDGGVDGVVNQDRLGLDQIYVQAKRYRDGNNVSPKDVREFNTSVQAKQASKGVFITTSKFTNDARAVLPTLMHTRIVLIDGDDLTDLMLDYGVGVTVDKTYLVFKIDENFFNED
jgi:restriction system protein